MLLHLSGIPWPVAPDRLFGRPGPLVLEVGFGDGWFLTELARTHPDWNVLGAEVSVGSVTRALKRVRRAEAVHMRLYLGQARFVVRDLLPVRSLHRVYVNFPDPWPKHKHRDRRLLRAPFFRLLSTRLEDGGSVLLTTDHAAYFDFAVAEARSTGLFSVEQHPPPPATLQTKYARKWRARDLPIQHAVFTRVAEADEAFAPAVETTDAMHHALLTGTLPPATAFEKIVHPFRGGHVFVLEVFRSVVEDGLLFAVRIEEADLTQEVLIEARPAPKVPDGFVVGVKLFGQPLTTRGTKEAVRAVTAWLTDRGMTLDQRFF